MTGDEVYPVTKNEADEVEEIAHSQQEHTQLAKALQKQSS
jgi:hypothetical protein